MKTRTFAAATLLAAGMILNASMVVSGRTGSVGDKEAASIWGGTCYNQGSTFTVCVSNSTCDPTIIPPIQGANSYYNLGSATQACYAAAVGKYVVCPCGNTSYGPFTGTSSGSCYPSM
jgi:hypothetical protein